VVNRVDPDDRDPSTTTSSTSRSSFTWSPTPSPAGQASRVAFRSWLVSPQMGPGPVPAVRSKGLPGMPRDLSRPSTDWLRVERSFFDSPAVRRAGRRRLRRCAAVGAPMKPLIVYWPDLFADAHLDRASRPADPLSSSSAPTCQTATSARKRGATSSPSRRANPTRRSGRCHDAGAAPSPTSKQAATSTTAEVTLPLEAFAEPRL
jgi:hypothetical protein